MNKVSTDNNTDLSNQPDLIIDTDDNQSWARGIKQAKKIFFESLDIHELFRA